MRHRRNGKRVGTYLSKDPRAVQLRVFECTVCGHRQVHTKRHGKTPPGHVKTTWCVWCQAATDQIQIE